MKLEFTITQEDLVNARRNVQETLREKEYCQVCLVAEAIRRELKIKSDVERYAITADGKMYTLVQHPGLRNLIGLFDEVKDEEIKKQLPFKVVI